MVPPLQLELELLKKSAGVENIHDEEETVDDEAANPLHSYPDPLKQMKRNAGLASVVNNGINAALLGK